MPMHLLQLVQKHNLFHLENLLLFQFPINILYKYTIVALPIIALTLSHGCIINLSCYLIYSFAAVSASSNDSPTLLISTYSFPHFYMISIFH